MHGLQVVSGSLSVHIACTCVIILDFCVIFLDNLAQVAIEILILFDVMGFEANAEEMIPKFAFVALHPVNLKTKKS